MLQGNTIIVLGGSGLIGRAVSRHCAELGAEVVIAGREAGKSAKVFAEDSDFEYSFLSVDILDADSLNSMFEHVDREHGQVSGIVNLTFLRNANFGRKFEDVTIADFNDNVSAHLGSSFLVCQRAIEHFGACGGGAIVNFSSIYGVMAPRFEIYADTLMTKEIEYIVCKSAIIQMTKYLAKYTKGKNIRVNCISPGGVKDSQPTPFVSAYNKHGLNKGMLDGADIAGTVAFLLSSHSQYVNGQNIIVDDGFSL